MSSLSLRPSLFDIENAGMRAVVLEAADVSLMQQFFHANPGYFLTVFGHPPRTDEAQREWDDLPPADMTFSRRLHIGFVDGAGELIGVAGVLADFLCEGVWHIGLFVVATSLHGGGVSRKIHAQLEKWMKQEGAQWVRLGVIEGNTRGERFWERSGYSEVRRRLGVEMGNRVNTLRVMVKTLGGGSLEAYLKLVTRDRPE
ncbi:MAG: GNAT family N-acetyltransferase [Betaproteobacteria bacterium]